MLRILLRDQPPRTLQETDFIREIEADSDLGFPDAPPGPVTVEVLDDRGRLMWKAYYPAYPRLVALARELTQERALYAESR